MSGLRSPIWSSGDHWVLLQQDAQGGWHDSGGHTQVQHSLKTLWNFFLFSIIQQSAFTNNIEHFLSPVTAKMGWFMHQTGSPLTWNIFTSSSTTGAREKTIRLKWNLLQELSKPDGEAEVLHSSGMQRWPSRSGSRRRGEKWSTWPGLLIRGSNLVWIFMQATKLGLELFSKARQLGLKLFCRPKRGEQRRLTGLQGILVMFAGPGLNHLLQESPQFTGLPGRIWL